MTKIAGYIGWALAGALGLGLLLALAGVISAGPLDPPGTPGPTIEDARPGRRLMGPAARRDRRLRVSALQLRPPDRRKPGW